MICDRCAHTIEHTVFVYRHRETKEITAVYLDEARPFDASPQYEHIATLSPARYIQAHYDEIDNAR